MLPIDEHARDGNVHLVSGEGWKEPTLAWWRADLPGWVDQGGMPLPMQPTHYVPMPWLMHAGAMRAALKEVDRAVYSDDYANAALLTDFNQGLVDNALAATEWPKKEETTHDQL